jgi:PAS domain S-box-containing protein
MAKKPGDKELEQKVKKLEKEIALLKKTLESLREAEERYRILVETSPDVISRVSTEEETIKSLNPAFEKVTGWPREEWIGKPFLSVIHPDDVPIAEEKYQQFLKGEVLSPFELRILSKAGNELIAEFMIKPETKSGKSVGFFCFVRDITERKRAEEALKEREIELEIKSRTLEETNAALRHLLKERKTDKSELEEKVLTNVRELILPYVERMKDGDLDNEQRAFLGVIESNLKDIVSTYLPGLPTKYLTLTPTEIQVANLIKQGRYSKDIAKLMDLSRRTVESHRDGIRRKLGIKGTKTNLRSYLLSTEHANSH